MAPGHINRHGNGLGMPQKYSNPLSLTSQFFFCGLPLRLDSYRGCAFQCSFCFARQRGGASPAKTIAPADPQYLRRVLNRALGFGNSNAPGILASFLRRHVPVHFGGMSDPFQPAETRHRVTLEYLRALLDHQYPTVISTRGTLVAKEPYLSLLRDMKVAVQFSFTSTRPKIANVFEPHVAAPAEMLRTMTKLSDSGVPVVCRWQPYIRGASESPREFVRRVTDAGARHVALEHLKIPLESGHAQWKRILDTTNLDLRRSYLSLGAQRSGRDYVLPPELKLDTVLETRREVRERSATFGAADNEFQYLSDTACCCSGVDQFSGFGHWFGHQIGYAIRKCRDQERIVYGAISNTWTPDGSIDRWVNSRTRLSYQSGTEGTVRNHMRQRWNDTSSPLSPSKFYGVEPTAEFTRQGYRVYRWNPDGVAVLNRIAT